MLTRPHTTSLTSHFLVMERSFSVPSPSLDDTDKIDVISYEMPEIKKRLADAK